jgi:putative hydrolase of the HAD superfamily
MRETGLAHDAAYALQERYHDIYGATVVGLVRHHGVNAADFLDDVHAVDLSEIEPDRRLQIALNAYQGRCVVYTNGARGYAQRVLARLGIADRVDATVAIDDVGLVPKPEPAAFAHMAQVAAIDPRASVMFEDSARNLATAKEFGCATVLVGGPATLNPVDFHTPHLHDFLEEALNRHD